MASHAILSDIQIAALRLLGPPDHQPAALSAEDWHEIERLATDQRFGPHLHARLRRGEIVPIVPEAVAANWARISRANALEGLVQQRDLLHLTWVLEEAGIEVVALKGAWLAWYAYPSSAERVLRDLDLLVAESDASCALEVLLGEELISLDPLPENAEQFAAGNKQFPPLITPSGTIVELHGHAWEPPGSMEWPTPPTRDAELIANARRKDADGPKFLAPLDMLAHLAIHAAYSHRYEVGPLLLADIDHLLQTVTIDWSELWKTAEAGEYSRGVALTLALVDRWRLPGLLEQSKCPHTVSPEAIDHASALLLQPSSARRDTRSFAAFQEARKQGGLAKAAALGFSRLGKVARNPARLIKRVVDTAKAAGSAEVQLQARSSAEVGRWLESSG